MALTLSGTNGIVGAGFTFDPSGASVTVGVGTFANIVSPKFKTTGNGADVFGSGASGAYLKLINESATSNNSHQFTIDSYNASNTYWNKIKIDASEVHLNTYTGNRATLTNTALTFASGVNVVMASGNGIDFSAAGGSGAGSANALLDDYEEGTWTPSVNSGGFGINGTGTYTKIGNMVHVRIEDGELTGSGNSSRLEITTLPFTPAKWTPGSMYARYYNAEGSQQVSVAVAEGTNYFVFQEFGNEAIGSDFNAGYFVFNVLYRTT